jgi:glycosyltransferase involved in cell wall biosynthesis
MGDRITAVMITGLPGRQKLALAAITAYQQQTHQNRELLIIDQSPEPIVKDAADIKVIQVEDAGQTLGALRNISFDHAQGDWIIQADDDDWFHPERFRYQMSNAVRGKACLLRCQVRYDFTDQNMIFWKWNYNIVPGIPGTILFPNEPGLRYRDECKEEDTHFIVDHFNGRTVVAENLDFPQLYIRFYHGTNTWSRSHVMGNHAHSRPHPTAEAYVREVVASHYKGVQTEIATLA